MKRDVERMYSRPHAPLPLQCGCTLRVRLYVQSTPLRDNETMIRKLPSGEFRLYSRKKDPRTGKRRNLGTFKTREAAEKHERAVQFFKRH